MAEMKQGYNSRLNESLGMRNGAEKHGFKQSMRARRDESKGMSKKADGRAYFAVRSMDK